MKLYVLFDKNGDVLAHTRDEHIFKEYCATIKKVHDKELRVVTNKEDINKIETTYFKKTLWEDSNISEVDTEENSPLFDFAKEEYYKLTILIKDLDSVIENYEISKSDKKELKKSLKLLKRLSKKKNFKKATGVDLVSDISKNNAGINLKRIFGVEEDNNEKRYN